MESTGYKLIDGLDELQKQHELFADELILRLKYDYRLYDERPFPKTFEYVTLEICDAIFAISYMFRCHYRQVYFALHEELIDAEDFEKFCFALPVERSKRYSFNFLFRISYMFELTMYLYKEGYDYFDIARRCLAAYPDLLYFDASGGWGRLNEIALFVICATKVLEVDIAVEHPLLGTFIETAEYIPPDDDNLDITELLQESLDIDKMIEEGINISFEKDFFNPKDMQSIKILYKHFVAPRTPKTKCKPEDLMKISETFPLMNRVPFTVPEVSDTHYFIVYDIYVEKKEIVYYFRSYMDPEILEKYFPLKDSPDSPEEDNLDEMHNIEGIEGAMPEYFASDVSQEDSEEESNQFDVLKDACQCNDTHTVSESQREAFDEFLDNLSDFHASDSSEGESSKSESSIESVQQEFDKMKVTKDAESSSEISQATSMYTESFKLLPWLSVTKGLPVCFETGKIVTSKSSANSEAAEVVKYPPSRSVSSIPELSKGQQIKLIKIITDISRLSREKKEQLVMSSHNIPELESVTLPFLRNILMSVQHSPYGESTDLHDSLRNILYVSPETKCLLFKIIMKTADLTIEERDELFRILFNIADNPVSQKVGLIKIINKMCGITEKTRYDLIGCVVNMTHEECNMISLTAASISIPDKFQGIFQDEEALLKEYERCKVYYTNENEMNLEKLKKLYGYAIKQKEDSVESFEGTSTAQQIAARPRAKPKKLLTQEPNKCAINTQLSTYSVAGTTDKYMVARFEINPKKEYALPESVNKCFEKGAQSGISLASTLKSLEEKYCNKSEMSNPSPKPQRSKASKKSRKRSKK